MIRGGVHNLMIEYFLGKEKSVMHHMQSTQDRLYISWFVWDSNK